MALISEVKPEDNVWELYPALSLIKEFRELKKREGDERSSAIIKAIFLIWDPKSPYHDSGMRFSKILEDVNEYVLNEEAFDWVPYENFKNFFINANTSRLEALLISYEKEINDFKQMISNWKWSKEDATSRAKVMKEYKALIEDFAETKQKLLNSNEDDVEFEGGYTKSFLEDLGSE